MAKKTYISPAYQKRDFSNVDKIVEDATGQSTLSAVKDKSTFSLVDKQPKIPKAKNQKNIVVVPEKVEKKERNITKPLGMPVKLVGDEKRKSLTTSIRITFNDMIDKLAYEQKKSKADILDTIIKHFFESKK